MKYLSFLIIIIVLIIQPACANAQQLKLTSFASGLTRPVCIENAGDERIFVVEQTGKIKIILPDGTILLTPFLNIQDIVNDNSNEQGLLGLAFHPDYETNGYFYVNYTASNGSTQISRFKVDANNPDLADAESEFQLLNIAQPFANHNGGDIHFGPDGFLYIGMGDGGSGGDPGNRAQNLEQLLGKMLRIDVNNGNPYAIPTDNPFVNNPNALNEIWAYGVRNPWRFSFDPLTGDMWIGDVGQNEIEEIDFQAVTSQGGENYGWRCYEGTEIYSNDNDCPPPSEVMMPVYEFTHSGSPGGCSVTGGIVYRGIQFPDLYGHYFFTDFCGDWIMSLYDEGGNWQTINHGVFNAGSGYSTFGVDKQGEMYIAALFTGKIYKIQDETTGKLEHPSSSKLKIYPNPASSEFTAEVFIEKNNQNFSLIVSDMTGRHLKNFKLENGINKLEISTLSFESGIYMLSLYDGFGQIEFSKLTVNKF